MTRRADRLFQIVQILRGRRLTTAALLAERLGVSERTVYRDIRDLSLSGVPVEGEAGSGYRLLAGYDLPPLMLTTKESEALIAAIRLLKTWGGERCRSRWSPPRKKCWRSCRRRVGARRSRLACLPLTLARIAMLKPILTLSTRPYPISRYYSFTTRMNPVR
ncbi:biotin operon repressor [Serratia liquefaciens]|nr:biotin operon repressor [Serratia liquefaciens]